MTDVEQAPRASLWRHHDFRQLWVGDTVSQFGTQLSQLALPVLAVTVLHAGPRDMGLLTAFETLAFLVVGLPAGAWVDRWRKQRVLVLGDLARAVVLGSVPLAWAAGHLTLGQLYAVALVAGVATVFFDVAYQSYLPSIVEGDQVVDGNAKLQASQSVAMVAGPAVGGALLRVLAAPVLVAADAVSFVLSALFVRRIRHTETPPDRATRRPLRVEIAEGLSFVVRHPLLVRITACTSIGNFAGGLVNALFVLYVLQTLGLGTALLGVLFTVGAVGGLVGAVVTSRVVRVVGEGRTIPVSAVVFGIGELSVPLASYVDGTAAGVILLGAGSAVFVTAVVVYNVTQVSFRQRLCPPALLGRMNASVRFLVWGSQPLGALAGGFLGASIGLVPTLWIGAALHLASSLPVLLSPLPRMRDLPRELDATVS
ncbi:MAG TPA: MFS transporter [Kineosporiaceae bacterium]|nr:MFS transporter [Kineosporiaceae bacterium]